jgi:hypothetical protein
MAKGEARFNAAGTEVVHFSSNPIPEDDYQLELGEEMEIRRSKEKGPDAIPYIGVRFIAQGTAAKEGQKDRLVFQNFLLSLKPGKDNVLNPARGGQLIEFYRARGEELDAPVLTHKMEDGEEVQYLDPETVLEQLKEWAGTVTPGHVVIEKNRDRETNKVDQKDPGRNKIGKWLLENVQEQAPKATGTHGTKPGTVTNLKTKKR